MCVCHLHAVCLYGTGRVCVLSSYSRFRGWAQHLKTTDAQGFHFGQSRQMCCSLQHDTKPHVSSLTADVFCCQRMKGEKESWQKLGMCVCLCVRMRACSSPTGCVWLFLSISLSHTRGGRILCNFGLLKTEMTIKATTLF